MWDLETFWHALISSLYRAGTEQQQQPAQTNFIRIDLSPLRKQSSVAHLEPGFGWLAGTKIKLCRPKSVSRTTKVSKFQLVSFENISFSENGTSMSTSKLDGAISRRRRRWIFSKFSFHSWFITLKVYELRTFFQSCGAKLGANNCFKSGPKYSFLRHFFSFLPPFLLCFRSLLCLFTTTDFRQKDARWQMW